MKTIEIEVEDVVQADTEPQSIMVGIHLDRYVELLKIESLIQALEAEEIDTLPIWDRAIDRLCDDPRDY